MQPDRWSPYLHVTYWETEGQRKEVTQIRSATNRRICLELELGPPILQMRVLATIWARDLAISSPNDTTFQAAAWAGWGWVEQCGGMKWWALWEDHTKRILGPFGGRCSFFQIVGSE